MPNGLPPSVRARPDAVARGRRDGGKPCPAGIGRSGGGGARRTEGLVTHLTSLVLVDEAGAVQETVPAMRKIPLPTPPPAFVPPVDAHYIAEAAGGKRAYQEQMMASMPVPRDVAPERR